MITHLKPTIAPYDNIIYVSQTIYKTMRKYIWLELICSYIYIESEENTCFNCNEINIML